jgi:hypothetical protein
MRNQVVAADRDADDRLEPTQLQRHAARLGLRAGELAAQQPGRGLDRRVIVRGDRDQRAIGRGGDARR